MSGEDIRAELDDRLKRLMKTSFCSSLQANSDTNSCVQECMQIEAHFDIETIERLGKQSKLLLRMYQAEFAKDPASPATERLRSNMIAVQDSISQIYGPAAALEVANSLRSATDAVPTDEQAG